MANNVSLQYNGGLLPDIISRALSLRNLVSGYESRKGLSSGCRAGLTLERCSQLASFAIQPGG